MHRGDSQSDPLGNVFGDASLEAPADDLQTENEVFVLVFSFFQGKYEFSCGCCLHEIQWQACTSRVLSLDCFWRKGRVCPSDEAGRVQSAWRRRSHASVCFVLPRRSLPAPKATLAGVVAQLSHERINLGDKKKKKSEERGFVLHVWRVCFSTFFPLIIIFVFCLLIVSSLQRKDSTMNASSAVSRSTPPRSSNAI